MSALVRRFSLLACVSVFVVAPSLSAGVDAHRKALLDGVGSLGTTGVPGNVVLFGPEAFALVAGDVGPSAQSAVVAASTLGAARIVAFGHNGYWSAQALDGGDGWRLFGNSLRWAAGSSRAKVRVVTWKNADFAKAIASHGFEADSIDSLARLETKPRPDVFCFAAWALSSDEEAALTRFARAGGGVLVADTGWGWEQLNPGKTLARDHATNGWLAGAGLAFGGATPDAGSTGAYATVKPISRCVNALDALDVLSNAESTRADAVQAGWSLMAALEVAPDVDKLVRPRVAKLRASREGVVPTPQSPLKPEQVLERVMLASELSQVERDDPQKVRAHAAAAKFPGSVPAGTTRVARVVEVDAGIQGWLSTGLYAAPGDVVEVSLPKEQRSLGWIVQIGAHADDLTSNEEPWRRAPRVVFRWPIAGESTRVASPLGGLLYLVPPPKSTAGKVEARFRGAVEAPRFVLGVTRPDEWRTKFRVLSAPWAEFETKKIILTLPAHVTRAIDDPSAILSLWDRVLDADAELASIDSLRTRPERFVTDEQIGGGYMHSGYPIMAHLDAAEFVSDVERLKKDGWGPFHELGHNHQDDLWTFDGTGEVTCNLFTLYAFEKVFEKKPEDDPRFTAAAREQRWREHAGKGAPFAAWKDEPFLALLLYVDVQQAFGWEPLRAAIASYAKLETHEKPKSDDDKRDRWLIQLSKATGKDLGALFDAWGVPISERARAAVTNLPGWKPDWMKSK